MSQRVFRGRDGIHYRATLTRASPLTGQEISGVHWIRFADLEDHPIGVVPIGRSRDLVAMETQELRVLLQVALGKW